MKKRLFPRKGTPSADRKSGSQWPVTLTQASGPVQTAGKSFTIAWRRANLSGLRHGILKHPSVPDPGEVDANGGALSEVGRVDEVESGQESRFWLPENST